jgi:hypothetical protein
MKAYKLVRKQQLMEDATSTLFLPVGDRDTFLEVGEGFPYLPVTSGPVWLANHHLELTPQAARGQGHGGAHTWPATWNAARVFN